jgi:PAS domain S-box-containing protein
MGTVINAIRQSGGTSSEELFADARRAVFVQIDRLFAGLMVFQWLAGIAAALIISPRTWAGSTSEISSAVWAAIFIGGAISAFPVFLALTRAGETLTRYVIAVGQMLTGALLIHLTGGRIETHFHVFGSLAFLSLYRDWKVLIPATLVVAADHFLRGAFFPQSIYGVLSASPWRSFEHAGWVIFEDIILIAACINSEQEMRRIAEQTAQIRQSETRTRQIIATALDAVVLMDQFGVIIDWNPQAEAAFGWSAKDVLGKKAAQILVPQRFRDGFAGALEGFLETGASDHLNKRIETTAINREGKEVPVEVAMGATRVGREYIFSAFMRNISQRKQIMEELTQAKEAAEESNRSKSAFLANMSHEIRTPMSAILGYSDLLLEPSRTQSDKVDSLQVIRRNARHLLQLINDILDISKIEAGKMSPETIECDLPATVAEVTSMIRPRATEKNLEFRVVFDGPIPRKIRTDSMRLKQILTNLLGNAVKFTLRGMVTLRVSCQRREDGSRIQFDVADTGVGMNEKQMGRLFQAFTQADESTTRKFGGTGLGLVISKRLAVLLGGDITVESTPMVGSIFKCFIEAGDLDGVEMITNANEGLLEAQEPQAVSGRRAIRLSGRVLLAEDGPDNQLLLSLHLREAGADVTVAENGRMAVNLAKSQPFDLILMDMQMPELDGYGATKELRRLNFKLPIIALTAHAMEGDREKCMAAGCTDYLSKPVERDDLLQLLNKYLARAEPADQAKSAPAAINAKPSCLASPAALATFVDRLPERVDALTRHLEEGEIAELERVCHQLKGVGSSYGFPAMTSTAGNAERQIGAAAELDQVKASVEELISIIRNVHGYAPEKEKYASASSDHR